MKIIAMNLVNGAVTEYEGVAFNSLAAAGGRIFAAGPDGLFELTGTTDNGAPIAARAKLGQLDFGDSRQKRAAGAYVEGRGDGDLSLHVFTDAGEDYEYPVEAFDDRLINRRVHIGKGIRTRRWQFGLSNPSGGDFEVSTVSVMVDATTRRIG